jgi:hypothetical protein
MQGRIISNVTPQQKIVGVNNKFGNTNIKNQQGTTRTLFDTLPLDGRTTWRFFEDANTRQFPLTNIGSEGNRLSVGETFVIQKAYLSIVSIDPDTQQVTGITTIPPAPAFVPFVSGELDFIIANSQVIKQLPTSVFQAITNPTSNNQNDVSFNFSTDIVIPPLLEYVAQLRTTSNAAQPGSFLRLTVQGTAGIIAPQTTF